MFLYTSIYIVSTLYTNNVFKVLSVIIQKERVCSNQGIEIWPYKRIACFSSSLDLSTESSLMSHLFDTAILIS